LAYLLNKTLNIGLQRRHKDITNTSKATTYSIYEWEDTLQYNIWNLVANNCNVESNRLSNELNSLFKQSQLVTKSYQLVPEFKKANYLLKIQDDMQNKNTQDLLENILNIPQIITAYAIEIDQLKSKDNLIFN